MLKESFLAASLVSLLAGLSLQGTLQAQCEQTLLRGDSNEDGTLDLSDGIRTLIFLFSGGAAVPCLDALDSNDSGDIDLSDGIYTFQFLFSGGKAPPPPGASECGVDPTADALDCASFAPCALECRCSDGERRPCGTSDVGACRFGFQICRGGVWGPCEGSVEPGAELCDQIDNDCDGITDNGFEEIGKPCDGPDDDLCTLGVLACIADATALVCDEAPGAGIVEVCDGLDNDCDQAIDDGFDTDEDGWTTCGGDCDDTNVLVNPGRTTDPVDRLDNDCDGEIDEGPFTTSYARDIQPIWNANCNASNCHDVFNPTGSMDLSPAGSYADLVGQQAMQGRGLIRVTPGDEDASYLWHKLNNTQQTVGGSGRSMPQGAPLLSKATRDVIRRWILEGARE